MELKFEKTEISCLDAALQDIQNSEQTQEIKLPDGMPDAARIIASWGQVILRGKEWRSDSISFSGGIMVWVLYAPEDGSQERCIDSWIPFQMRWDLPEDCPEGKIRIRCLPRFVDARIVSPRKIMVRTGIGAMAEAFVPRTAEVFAAAGVPSEIELLRSTYPVRLYKEAGEKNFLVDEELSLPDSVPQPEAVTYYQMNPKLSDKKVLGNKVVFRGNGNLHLLYRSEEGQLHGWDFDLPFSQFAQLEGEYGSDAQADMILQPTNLELELDEEGRFHLKGSMVAQYVITDKQMLELVEDAYSPARELGIRMEELELPTVLETRRENLYGEQTIPAQANIAVDTNFMPDFPRKRRTGDSLEMEIPGTFQVLYYGEDGVLRSGTARWEGQQRLGADENSMMALIPMGSEAQAMTGNGQILAKTEIPMEMTARTLQRIPMLTDVEVGEAKKQDPNRPNLILRRMGEDSLWELAKRSNSTMDAIRRVNQLQGDPAPGQMLLIPVS